MEIALVTSICIKKIGPAYSLALAVGGATPSQISPHKKVSTRHLRTHSHQIDQLRLYRRYTGILEPKEISQRKRTPDAKDV